MAEEIKGSANYLHQWCIFFLTDNVPMVQNYGMEVVMKKYYQVEMDKTNRTSVCPVCANVNDHKRTVDNCNHLHKLTAKGVAFYFWGFRPEGFNAQKVSA